MRTLQWHLMPLGDGQGQNVGLKDFAIFWLCCRRGYPCFTNTSSSCMFNFIFTHDSWWNEFENFTLSQVNFFVTSRNLVITFIIHCVFYTFFFCPLIYSKSVRGAYLSPVVAFKLTDTSTDTPPPSTPEICIMVTFMCKQTPKIRFWMIYFTLLWN